MRRDAACDDKNRLDRCCHRGVARRSICSTIRGPVTSPGTISLNTGFDITQVGYERSEYYLGGLAVSYHPTAPMTSDGKWSVELDPVGGTAQFDTRMVVYRPSDPAKFNGTVIVEWLNVTAGLDLANDWVMAHTELVRQRLRVGRRVGPGGGGQRSSRPAHPTATASSTHPGDSYSYDIFSRRRPCRSAARPPPCWAASRRSG